MTGPLYRVGWFCTRHHWPVIAVWVLAAVALALGASAAGQQNSDNLSLPGHRLDQGARTCSSRSSRSRPTAPTRSCSRRRAASSRTRPTRRPWTTTVESLKKATTSIRAVSPLSEQGSRGPQQGQDDRLHLGDARRGPERPHEGGGRDHHRRDRPGEETPASTSPPAATSARRVSKADTESSEAVGMTAAVIILLFAFGTATAMLVPDRHRGLRARGLAVAHPAARPRGRGARASRRRSRR